MPDIQDTEYLAPDFVIKLNGSDAPPELVSDLIAVAVEEDVDIAGMFTFKLINWDMSQLQVKWSDDDLFQIGAEVEIQMGYVDDLITLIKGEITGLEPEFCAEEVPTLTVRGYDRRHRLMRSRKTRSFTQITDSDIASQIASDAGLTPDVENTGVTHEYLLQHNQTDFEFLQKRAGLIGYEVVVDASTLMFRTLQNTQTEVLTLFRDADLLQFYPRLTTQRQVGQFEVRGWNPAEKAEIVSTAGIGDESTTMGGQTVGPAAGDDVFGESKHFVVDTPVFSQAEADQIAAGQFNESALAYITGDGLCVGRSDLRSGTVIQIEGLGDRFSGLYYITSVSHRYTPRNGYRTHFQFRRNAT